MKMRLQIRLAACRRLFYSDVPRCSRCLDPLDRDGQTICTWCLLNFLEGGAAPKLRVISGA